jgi:hypothetical protein
VLLMLYNKGSSYSLRGAEYDFISDLAWRWSHFSLSEGGTWGVEAPMLSALRTSKNAYMKLPSDPAGEIVIFDDSESS